MIHNRQGINIPGRNLTVVSVLLDTKALQEDQVYEVKPNLLLTNEQPKSDCSTYVTYSAKGKA